MNGRHSISIAVLTENQDDVELINSSLRDAGHAAHCLWTNNPKHLGETLAAENVELLILNCDNYPDTIRQVIKQKDRFNPEVPLIVIQEQADEFSMQKAMKNGACDLVSIGNKDRLQSVVSRELRALRVERTLNSTIHSATEYKKQLKDYMQTSPDAIALVEEGIVTDVNDSWLKLFRAASNDEVTGLPLQVLQFRREPNGVLAGTGADLEHVPAIPQLDSQHFQDRRGVALSGPGKGLVRHSSSPSPGRPD